MPLSEIIVHEPLGIDRPAESIVGGIPVARGKVNAGGWFSLKNETGARFPVDGTPAAWWPDGSVKWLHVCGQVDLAGGAANAFTLEPLDDVPEHAQSAERVTDYHVRISGGLLDVEIRADVQRALQVKDAATGQSLTVPPGLSLAYQLTETDESSWRRCSFEFLREPLAVVAESPNRTVVRLAGHFLDRQAREVALVRLFVEVLRESREVRLQPVLIPVGYPDEEKIRAFHLTVHSALRSGDRYYAFGDERGPGYDDPVHPHHEVGPRWPQARQVQLGSSFYKTEKRTGSDWSWTKAVEGQRAQGWCHLGGETGGVTGAMRYFWQEYPHSLEVDADDGTLTFGMIPAAAEALDLRRYSPHLCGGGAPPEDTMYEYGEGPDEPRLSGARGIAKAHELAVIFHPAGDRDIARQALSFLAPCRPMATPQAFADSLVVGHVAPFEPTGAADDAIARVMDFLIDERDVRGWYGLMNYGDVMMSYYGERDRWAFDDGGHAWLNTESIPDYGLWLNALRAGNPGWLGASIDMSRHNRDVDCYHWGDLKGLGTRHNVNHWGCRDKEWRVSMPITRRLHYYVTADPWTAEAIREHTAVIQSYTRTRKFAPGMSAGCTSVYVKWEMSGDEADGEVVRKIADGIAALADDNGEFYSNIQIDFATGECAPVGDKRAPRQSHFWDNFGPQHFVTELADVLEHEELRAALVRHADFRMGMEVPAPAGPRKPGTYGRDNAMEFIALAYRETGEDRFREALLDAISRVEFTLEEIGGDGILDAPRHLRFPGIDRRNKFVCTLGRLFLNDLPFALKVTGSPRD